MFRPIYRPIARSIATALNKSRPGGFSPTSLFVSGEQGYVYDLNDSFAEKTAYRRNLLTYSEQFDNAIWAKSGSAIAANTAVAPDGTSTADTLTASATTDRHRVASPATAISAGSAAVGSVYVKAGTANFAILSVSGSTTNSAWSGVVVNLSTGAITSTTNGASASSVSASITAVGNGWYRIVLTAICGSDVTANLNVNVSDTGTPALGNYAAYSWTAAGTESILIWGAQLEARASATEYQRVTDWNTELLAAFPQTTVFLDSAGTTAASVNGLVGLVLDKSKGLALGAELATNPDFTGNATGWLGAGFVYGTNNVVASAASDIYQLVTPPGGLYEVTVVVSSISSGSIYVFVGNGTTGQRGPLITSAGTYTCRIFNGTANNATGVWNNTSNAVVESISIKAVSGNHAYQSTTGNKPVLRGSPIGANLVTNGDFASGTGWVPGGGWSIAAGVATHAIGTTDSLVQTMTLVEGKTYRVTYTVSAVSGSSSVQPRFTGGTTVSGTGATAAGTVVTYMTALAGNNTFSFVANSAFGCSIDNIEVVDVSAGQVQAPYALQFDGVDDFLQTASVNFTATDKMTVCHGVRRFSTTGTNMLAELSASTDTNNGSFVIYAPYAGFGQGSVVAVRGTVSAGYQDTADTGMVAPSTYVSSVRFNTAGVGASNQMIQRINGVSRSFSATNSATTAGNYANAVLYFGRRGGTSLPYNGLMFSAICVGKAVSATELANIERWTNQRTGAY